MPINNPYAIRASGFLQRFLAIELNKPLGYHLLKLNLIKEGYMSKKNAFYAQSGGVTSVINATAAGVIETARKSKKIGKVFAGKNGILGALDEELIDTSKDSLQNIKALLHTPGGAFGSCRYKLKSYKDNMKEYDRILEVFQAHNIGYFFYNGGGDSHDTAHKISELCLERGLSIQCIGIPKTIDNDLPLTDNSPGFGSVAKYVAISTAEAGLDVKSMCSTSTKVFILEVMGRHAGWIAAASGLAQNNAGDSPHIILFPEVIFNKTKFLTKVRNCVKKHGFCTIVASEGLKAKSGKFLSDQGNTDAFGHAQLGGVASILANMIKEKYGYKYHFALADYLQRSARHIASKTDLDQAFALGVKAVKLAEAGKNAIMPIITRTKQSPYRWKISHAPLSKIANVEKKMPKSFISADGMHITKKCRDYLSPLIQGEAWPPFKNGVPVYANLKNILAPKKLKKFKLK